MDPSTLSQKVYEELHHRLRTGSLPPGTRLVNRTLAAELGTSTIPVREAINRLASEGLLQLTPGAGAFVRSPDLEELAELYDVREALEVLAAGEAARFAGAALLVELRSVCERLRAVVAGLPRGGHATPEQFHQWLELEEQFHTRLVAGSRNRWLVRMVSELRVIAQVFHAHRLAGRLLTEAVAEATLRGHEEFLDLLTRRDVEGARAWMTSHIRNGREEVLRHLAFEATRQG